MSKTRCVKNKTTNLKTKVKHVEKESNEERVREISKRIYNQRFQKYFVLPLIPTIYNLKCKIKEFQKSKRSSISYQSLLSICSNNQHSNRKCWCSVREDFVNFFTLIYFRITLEEHALTIFSNLLNFFHSWVQYCQP
jgi:hypothetical protein